MRVSAQRRLSAASSFVGVLLHCMSCAAHSSQVVSQHYTPLARFVKHGVPVVVATDNDGIMRMVGGGIFSGQSVKSELWHAVIHGCLAPALPPDSDAGKGYPPLRVLDACDDGGAAGEPRRDGREHVTAVQRRCVEVPASPYLHVCGSKVAATGDSEVVHRGRLLPVNSSAIGRTPSDGSDRSSVRRQGGDVDVFWQCTWANMERIVENMKRARFGRVIGGEHGV